tara:strand:- start:453 stop:1244 length:792 start_codon:yes stop_codon:yes gene_type:complete
MYLTIPHKTLASFILLNFFLIVISYDCLSDSNPELKKNHSIIVNHHCTKALEFYLDRPDLETEFLRRLQYCKEVAKDTSPNNLKANPIISNFASMFGVNGRTRMQIHQGIDILGSGNEPIIAIADGKVLETGITNCVGPTLVIDHGLSPDNKKLIALYSHVGDFLVKEGDIVKRGMKIAKLPEKIEHACMARVRHLHLQIGQEYCEKDEKDTWGCQYYIKDLYSSLNPNDYWADGPNKVTCFDKTKSYPKGTITFPFNCKANN